MSAFRIIVDYPHPPERVWRALTDPALVPLWTEEGLGGRPEGFAAAVGTKFRFVAKPQPWWRGFVECEVVAVHAPLRLSYTWIGDEGERPSCVTYDLAATDSGTRLTFDHTGFTGVGGFMVSKVLARVRKKMLVTGLPRVLADLGTAPQASPRI